jgi:hypothetical protein
MIKHKCDGITVAEMKSQPALLWDLACVRTQEIPIIESSLVRKQFIENTG